VGPSTDDTVLCCTTTAVPVREHARAVNTRGIPSTTPSQSFQYLYARPSCRGRRGGGRWSVFKNKNRRLVDSRLLHHRVATRASVGTRAARRSRQVVVVTRLRFTNNNKNSEIIVCVVFNNIYNSRRPLRAQQVVI